MAHRAGMPTASSWPFSRPCRRPDYVAIFANASHPSEKFGRLRHIVKLATYGTLCCRQHRGTELGMPGSVGAAGGQLPAATRHQVLSCEPGWNAVSGQHGPWRVFRAASNCRNPWYQRHTPIPMPAFVPACLRCPQAERLVSPGRRCAAAPADALHLSRSRGSGRYPSLPVNDAGVVATGLTALRALCKGTER